MLSCWLAAIMALARFISLVRHMRGWSCSFISEWMKTGPFVIKLQTVWEAHSVTNNVSRCFQHAGLLIRWLWLLTVALLTLQQSHSDKTIKCWWRNTLTAQISRIILRRRVILVQPVVCCYPHGSQRPPEADLQNSDLLLRMTGNSRPKHNKCTNCTNAMGLLAKVSISIYLKLLLCPSEGSQR